MIIDEQPMATELVYKDAGSVAYKIAIDEGDVQEIIEEYLRRHAAFAFNEMERVNNHPVNIWIYATCRRDVEDEDDEAVNDTEVDSRGDDDGHPTGESS